MSASSQGVHTSLDNVRAAFDAGPVFERTVVLIDRAARLLATVN